MKMIDYNSIGLYDKHNNLVSYVEFKDNNQDIKCFYKAEGRFLNRKYKNEYENGSSELINSIIEYDKNIMLYTLYVRGETTIKTILSGESFTSFVSPNISSRIDTYEDSEFEKPELQCFSVNSNLIKEWLNKV